MKFLMCETFTLIAGAAILLGSTLSANAIAADTSDRYAHMAAIGAYLMDRTEEIALARSAAPETISHHATILILGQRGYEPAIKGSNGFVCMVERGWVGAFDWPEMWNPRIRGADCLNPPAARTIVPLAKIRTNMFLAGRSTAEVIAKIKEALHSKEVPSLDTGAMSYMMSRGSYLTDAGEHDMAHLMFFLPTKDASLWGVGSKASPVDAGGYWFFSQGSEGPTDDLPPLTVFTVEVGTWSDGTPARMQKM